MFGQQLVLFCQENAEEREFSACGYPAFWDDKHFVVWATELVIPKPESLLENLASLKKASSQSTQQMAMLRLGCEGFCGRLEVRV